MAEDQVIEAQKNLQIARETLQSSQDAWKISYNEVYICQNEWELLMRLHDLKKYGSPNRDDIDEIIENDRFDNVDEDFKQIASNILTIDGELDQAITSSKNKLKNIKNITNRLKNKRDSAKTDVGIAQIEYEKAQTIMIIKISRK